MKLIIILLLISVGATAQKYDTSSHIIPDQRTGLQLTDARTFFYDTATFNYRPYYSKEEVFNRLYKRSLRVGKFPIYIGKQTAVAWYFPDNCYEDSCLIRAPITYKSINLKSNE